MSGFYLKYIQAILPETSPFLSVQIAFLSNVYSTWDKNAAD